MNKTLVSALFCLCLLVIVIGCSSSTSDGGSNSDLPDTPADVRLDALDDGTAYLRWSAVDDDDIKGYFVYWNAESEIDSLTSYRRFVQETSTEIVGLNSGTTYYFAVTSVNELDEESVLSTQVNGRYEVSIDLSPPPSPSGFEITSIGNGAVSLRWNMVEVDDLKGYNIYWRGGALADTVTANSMFTGDTSMTLANLDYEILYYFAISAVDQSGNESALSVQLNGKALNTTSPSPPTGVNSAAESVNVPLINIFWEQNSEPDLAYYKVYRALSPAGLEDRESAFVDSVFTEFYTDYDIEIGTMYYYLITALDKADWESAASPIASDKALLPVDLVSPINYQITSDTPTFRWQPVDGAVKYELTLKGSRIGSEIWYNDVNSDTTDITYTGSSALISGNTYYWQVGAITKTDINSVSPVGMFIVKTE